LIEQWRRLSIHPWVLPFTEWRIGVKWRLQGRPGTPPPRVKQALVKEYQRRFGLRVFVETGTYAGEMINAVVGRFDRIFSIELDDQWHAQAVVRFATRRDVTLLHGDSSIRLCEVLAGLREPALFWLDAHYCGPGTARGPLDSPIVRELQAIEAHSVRGHVVLIDDMRYFSGSGGYPDACALAGALRRNHPAHVVEIRDDVLRWHPARP
jgi:hypothetical protein